jgi:hypothetical protein
MGGDYIQYIVCAIVFLLDVIALSYYSYLVDKKD